MLAVSLDDRGLTVGLVDARGVLRDRAETVVDAGPGGDALEAVLAEIAGALVARGADRHDLEVVAVGAVVANQADPTSPGVTFGGELWSDLVLADWVGEHTRLPSFGDVDARGLALAEGWLGAAQGHANFCAITMASSITGGIVLDNDLLEGHAGLAGSIGHVIVEPSGRRCRCGARGCLDAEASGAAIEAITGRPVLEPTYEIMQRTGRMVGAAAATVCNALDLSLVVVGGPVALGFAATFFHSAQTVLDESCLVPYSRGARITPSRLGATGSLLGAGAVGWRGLRRSRRG